MFGLLFNLWVLMSCAQQDGVKPEQTQITPKIKNVSPYRHFEVTGPLRGIEMKQIDPESNAPILYSVSFLIEAKETDPPLDNFPTSLLVKGRPGLMRIALDELPSLEKNAIEADDRLSLSGPENNPHLMLSATKWGKYVVGESVSMGVIYTGDKR